MYFYSKDSSIKDSIYKIKRRISSDYPQKAKSFGREEEQNRGTLSVAYVTKRNKDDAPKETILIMMMMRVV